jgi:hypothetical protein
VQELPIKAASKEIPSLDKLLADKSSTENRGTYPSYAGHPDILARELKRIVPGGGWIDFGANVPERIDLSQTGHREQQRTLRSYSQAKSINNL